jgi:hypothetical protein
MSRVGHFRKSARCCCKKDFCNSICQEQAHARNNWVMAGVIGDSRRPVKLRLFEYSLIPKIRDRLGPTRFGSGKGDLIAGMQRV